MSHVDYVEKLEVCLMWSQAFRCVSHHVFYYMYTIELSNARQEVRRNRSRSRPRTPQRRVLPLTHFAGSDGDPFRYTQLSSA